MAYRFRSPFELSSSYRINLLEKETRFTGFTKRKGLGVKSLKPFT